MSIDHERRARQADISIRAESQELEKLRLSHQRASESLAVARRALAEIEAVIEDTEAIIHKAVSGGPALDLMALQAARYYLSQRHQARQRGLALLQRTLQKASQSETLLKQAALQVKGLERVKEASRKAVLYEQEKRVNDRQTEQWLQHYGRKHE